MSLCVVSVSAAESNSIALRATERQFQDFIASLKGAVRKKDSSVVYSLLDSNYYISRDFGGSFDSSASPTKNFSANFEFNNDNLRPEYKDYGWAEFRRAISSSNL